MAQDRREPVPLGLRLGVKCGGSDAMSGLTANPLIGRMTDAVTQAGGAAILTEIPEVFGAETLLLERATSAEVFDRLSTLVNRFKRYFLDHGEPVSENPSPGNIAGGITTLEEKSLGAVQKGGQAPVTDVIDYGGQITSPALPCWKRRATMPSPPPRWPPPVRRSRCFPPGAAHRWAARCRRSRSPPTARWPPTSRLDRFRRGQVLAWAWRRPR
jgi:hypothetical protein